MTSVSRERLCWKKSSYSGSQGECVEVAGLSEQMAVRDSKNLASGYLVFDGTEWTSFLRTLKGGGFCV
ncbi:DUF397 domain-containing protein [Nocardiopsis potens]|uniref:DUF397 domain-containing protein n=1 Tax=Nocardiopsis potens TaxID=1246458 RepID=UPI0009DB5254|nr:DUF397 domain-containing protein [Nocardiopsis potens]